jgi:hypothetical protein
MTTSEIRKEVRSLKSGESKEINGYIVRRCGKAYGIRFDLDEVSYEIYETQKEVIEAIA